MLCGRIAGAVVRGRTEYALGLIAVQWECCVARGGGELDEGDAVLAAALCGATDVLRALLWRPGVYYAPSYLAAALRAAAARGHAAAVAELLAAGAHAWLGLELAARGGHADAVAVLAADPAALVPGVVAIQTQSRYLEEGTITLYFRSGDECNAWWRRGGVINATPRRREYRWDARFAPRVPPPLVAAAEAGCARSIKAILNCSPRNDRYNELVVHNHSVSVAALARAASGPAAAALLAHLRYDIKPNVRRCCRGARWAAHDYFDIKIFDIYRSFSKKEELEREIDASGIDIHVGGDALLYLAARDGAADAARLLLRRGADPHARLPRRRHFILTAAAVNGHDRVVELLLAHGATDEEISQAAAHAARVGRFEMVRRLYI